MIPRAFPQETLLYTVIQMLKEQLKPSPPPLDATISALGAYTLPLPQGQDVVVGAEGLDGRGYDRLGHEQGGFTELYSRIQDY